MADIALMMAEEYEKRLKRDFPGDEAASQGRRNSGAVAKACGDWVESAVSGVKLCAALLARADVEELKTELAMAAFHGFFSA